MNAFKSRYLDLKPEIALEVSTSGKYIARKLRDMGFSVHLADPSKLSLIFMTAKKNNKEDSYKLAKLLRLQELPEVHLPSRFSDALRSIVRYRKSIGEEMNIELFICEFIRHVHHPFHGKCAGDLQNPIWTSPHIHLTVHYLSYKCPSDKGSTSRASVHLALLKQIFDHRSDEYYNRYIAANASDIDMDHIIAKYKLRGSSRQCSGISM